jgi:hypothetical protein
VLESALQVGFSTTVVTEVAHVVHAHFTYRLRDPASCWLRLEISIPLSIFGCIVSAVDVKPLEDGKLVQFHLLAWKHAKSSTLVHLVTKIGGLCGGQLTSNILCVAHRAF